jgi:anaerobic ribonucleoside-triphosphate reductase activating protein
MSKYVETMVTFSEVPDEITLAINISNCPCHCKGCHSSHLAENIGTPLTIEVLKNLVEANSGISCISFMGGDADPADIKQLATYIKEEYPELKVCWYSGRGVLPTYIQYHLDAFDYIKLGAYDSEYGPLTSKTTNQRFYMIAHLSSGVNKLVDLTYKFWNKYETED